MHNLFVKTEVVFIFLSADVEKTMWMSIEHGMLPAVAYAMLAASALWAFLVYSLTLRITFGTFTFALFFANGVLGSWHYVNIHKKQISPRIKACLKISKFLMVLYSLPLLVSDLCIKYTFSFELVFAHLLLPLLALVPYGTVVPADKSLLQLKRYHPHQNRVRDTIDFVLFCNVVSLAMVSIYGGDFSGVMASFVYAISHFIVTDEGYVSLMKMPAESIYVSGMGVFCLLGMRAMIAA